MTVTALSSDFPGMGRGPYRELDWQSRGRGFDPHQLHHLFPVKKVELVCLGVEREGNMLKRVGNMVRGA